jgi:hypothetical protein
LLHLLQGLLRLHLLLHLVGRFLRLLSHRLGGFLGLLGDEMEEGRNGRKDPDVRSAPVRGLVRFLGARQFPDEEEDGGPGTSTWQGAP